MLRQDHDHSCILVEGVLLQNPISLQAQLYVPQSSKGVGNCKLSLIFALMILGSSPKFNKGRNKFALIALGADMGQADNEVILEEALNNDIAIYSGEVEVNGELIDHL